MKIRFVGKVLEIERDKEKVIVIGDLHLGYEEALNNSGVLIGRKMFEEMVEDMDVIFYETGKVDKIILLGDVKHEFGGIGRQEWNDALELFSYLEKKLKKNGEIVITKGNHDNFIKNIASKRSVKVEEYYIWNGFAFLHGDKEIGEVVKNKEAKTLVMGHGHPAINISDGVKNERYKCFLEGEWKGKKIIILPSFAEYSEGTDPREREFMKKWNFDIGKFKVMVAGEKIKVLDFGELRKIKV